jgi:hypothetical protein
MHQQDQAVDLYRLLAVPVSAAPSEPPPPDTVPTATIETIDNNRATGLLTGTGLPLP